MAHSGSSTTKMFPILTQFTTAFSKGDLDQFKALLEKHKDIDINAPIWLDQCPLIIIFVEIINQMKNVTHADGVMLAKRKAFLKYLLTEKNADPYASLPMEKIPVSLFRYTTKNAALTEYLVRDCGVGVNMGIAYGPINHILAHTALYYSMTDLCMEQDKDALSAIKNNIIKLLTELKASVRVALPALLAGLSHQYSKDKGKITKQEVIDLFHKPILKVIDKLVETEESKKYLRITLSSMAETSISDKDTFEKLKLSIYVAIEKLFGKRPSEDKAADKEDEAKEAKTPHKEVIATPDKLIDEQEKSEEVVRKELTKLAAEQKTIQEKLILANKESTSKLKKLERKHKKRVIKFTESQQALLLEAAKAAEEKARVVGNAAKQLADESKQTAVLLQKLPRLQEEITIISGSITDLQSRRAHEETRIADLQQTSASKLKQIEQEKTKQNALNVSIATCEARVTKLLLQERQAKIKSESNALQSKIASLKLVDESQVSQLITDKRELLIDDKADQDAKLQAAREKESDILKATQLHDAQLSQQQALIDEQKKTLHQRQILLQQRKSALHAKHSQLQIRTDIFQMRMKQWLESQQAKSLPPAKKATGFQSRSVKVYRHSPIHDQLNDIINVFIFQYLPSLSFTTPALYVVGNVINDFLLADVIGFRDKLILTDTHKFLDLPSCFIMPVTNVCQLPADSSLNDAEIEVKSSGRKDQEPGLFQVSKTGMSLYLRQEVVDMWRAPQDVLRARISRAVFTKDRVILQVDQSSRYSYSGVFWYNDEKDLQALQKNELRLVDDLQSKNPILSFSMLDDLLQLGSEAKLIDPTPLRAWTEEFWNTVEYDLTLNKKFLALEIILLDQQKLAALQLMHQYHIAEPMLFPENPGAELTGTEFDTMYRKIKALQLAYLKTAKRQAMDTTKELKEVADSDTLRTAYLSQVYGVLIAFYYAKKLPAKLEESMFASMLDQFEPLFAKSLLSKEEMKQALTSTYAQQKPEKGLTTSVIAFFEAAAPALAASSAPLQSAVNSPESSSFR